MILACWEERANESRVEERTELEVANAESNRAEATKQRNDRRET